MEYEIVNTSGIPSVCFVVGDNKVPIDVFSLEVDSDVILEFDSALESYMKQCFDVLLLGIASLSITQNLYTSSRMRKEIRERFKDLF